MKVPISLHPCQHLLLSVMGVSFHLFRSCFISSRNVLKFPEYTFGASFVKLIPKCLTGFCSVINTLIFLNSILDCSFQCMEIDFSIFTSDPTALLNTSIGFNYVLVTVLGFPVYAIMSTVFIDNFTSNCSNLYAVYVFLWSNCPGWKF